MEPQNTPQQQVGLPRWLVIGFVAKMVVVVGIVLAVMWWANR